MSHFVKHAANTASTLRRPLGRPTKVRRKEPNEPQTIERLNKRGVDMRSKDIKLVPQLNNKLPQISNRVPQLNRLPQLSYLLPNSSTSCPKRKAHIQEKTNYC
ncbi:hypothetical protein GOBAR_AA34032 [Gossypium barbadense]|uniref:Uncharacterized protein n=1 Tax=Gossypium barbadense TaxID=3634 RepID=A0A2P5W6G0_GOSBA|nr:hypothetical protein GOBAR_AA34032 [Gossypium barbadense]